MALMTLDSAMRAYWRQLCDRGAKDSTKRQVSHQWNVLKDAFGANRVLGGLTVAQIDTFIGVRLKTHSRASVNGTLRVLRAAMRHSDIKHLKVKMLRENLALPEVLTDEQQRDLLDRAGILRPLLLCALDAGLRRGEIVKLTLDDVNFTDGFLIVQAQNAKSRKERRVPLTARLEDALAMRIGDRQGHQYLFPAHWFESAARHIRTLELKKPGLHALRRTWATRLLGKGVDVETVRQLGGWADLETVRRYITTTGDRMQDAIARLDRG